MIILITGPQASGKTTQAHKVSQALNFCEVDSGDLIRAFSKGDGETISTSGGISGQTLIIVPGRRSGKPRLSFVYLRR